MTRPVSASAIVSDLPLVGPAQQSSIILDIGDLETLVEQSHLFLAGTWTGSVVVQGCGEQPFGPQTTVEQIAQLPADAWVPITDPLVEQGAVPLFVICRFVRLYGFSTNPIRWSIVGRNLGDPDQPTGAMPTIPFP